MPIFEYRCEDCNERFEVLHRTKSNAEQVSCPRCNSVNSKKLLSAFATSMGSVSYSSGDSCSDGSCSTGHTHSGGCCGGGSCGLN